MKKITDERLILKNLQNIRIIYLLQTLGILGILGYDLVTKGFDGMRENPLWLVFMITTIISAYLSMNISVDQEESKKPAAQSLRNSLFVVVLVSVLLGFFVSITPGFTALHGILIGGVLLICGLAPILYVYIQRKKRQDEFFDE